MDVRDFTMDDYDNTLQLLWRARAVESGRVFSPEATRRKLERDPDLFLVAQHRDVILGLAVGSWDGHRGWISLLEVDPACRGQGIGTRLEEEMERRIKEKGGCELCLLIGPDQLQAQDFFQGRGFRIATDDINMTKALA